MKVSRAVFLSLAGLLSVWLVKDATTFGLYAADPITGRRMDCYTSIEMALGLKAPSNWIRPTEFGVGTLMFLGTLGSIAFAYRKSRKRKNA